jgi:hypothetical protein
MINSTRQSFLIGVARDFLMNYLPESALKMVELNDLELQNGSYVDENI